MGLVSIGPVTVSHGDPKFTSSASPLGHGIRTLAVSGSCAWADALTLEELVANEHNRTTRGGYTGVMEWLAFDDALLSGRTGDYLIETFVVDADHKSSLTTSDLPFTFTAAGPMP